jgi:hypothetical protein
VSNSGSTTTISLLGNGEFDTLALGKGDPRLLLTDNEDVAFTGSERVVYGILNVDNVETSIVTLAMGDNTNTTHVTTTSNHGNDTGIELDVLGDLSGSKVNLDSVVDLDSWVGVTDTTSYLLVSGIGNSGSIPGLRSGIVCDEVWDSSLTKLDTLDFSKLVLSLLSGDAVDSETALGVVDKTEVLASLLD